VDPVDGTTYWRFNTIHDHFAEDDTVLVWPSQTKSLGLSKKTCVSLIVRSKHYMEDEIVMELWE
jgi:hypothetical protein